MATTLDQIARYLDNRDWKYDFLPENSRIVTGVKTDNVDPFLIFITLKENGEYLELAAPQILHVQDHIYKGVLFQTLLAISSSTKMLRWEYDPMDGEVRASIGFPLEDALLTEQQFNRCLNALIQIVDSVAMPRIKAVLETGIDPEEKQLGERLLLTLEEILPNGSLTLLEQAIVARKQRGAA
ncbi:hypothetical protein ACE1CI_01510 [Aerosakkonemataceae cyanobacterium BLCC-F50]|uniref:YbjN domain-containing protein n=1 Tax=Floridaenema flaviceps BLCC-F50 TaxID=3153642 RepID=A0ABV4XIR0_9CYAN